MPGSAFTVSRTAHRNNTSNYYIGERRSNFGEVTDMLKAKGIDLDNNRFLILQVCLQRPKARVQRALRSASLLWQCKQGTANHPCHPPPARPRTC